MKKLVIIGGISILFIGIVMSFHLGEFEHLLNHPRPLISVPVTPEEETEIRAKIASGEFLPEYYELTLKMMKEKYIWNKQWGLPEPEILESNFQNNEFEKIIYKRYQEWIKQQKGQ